MADNGLQTGVQCIVALLLYSAHFGICSKSYRHSVQSKIYIHTAYYKNNIYATENIPNVHLHVCLSDCECVFVNDSKADVCMHVSPVRTVLAEGSARSRADLPSVFLMFGSAPCWSNTERNRIKQYSHNKGCTDTETHDIKGK